MASGGMGLAPFLWGEGGQRLSADEVARRRALASSLIPQQAPRDYWSGINSIVGNIGGALHNWQADQAEAAGRSEYEGLLAQALESGATDIASLAPLLTHDFASQGGSALGQALLNQTISQSDPMYQLRLQEAQLGLERARNPFQATPATPEQLAQWGIVPQAGESWTIGPDGLPQQVFAPASPAAPIKVGGVLVDPTTYQPVFDSRQNAAPSNVQEYEYYAQQAQSLGEQPLPFNQWDLERRGRGATQVNVGGQGDIGTIPPGYELFTDPVTGARSMRPIEGGPVWSEQQAEAAAQEAANLARAEQEARYGNVVVEDIDRAVEVIEDAPWFTTGILGQWTSGVGGTPANRLNNLLNTVKANAGFDRLQAMRDSSPTGGALGQVSNIELGLLQSAIGSLEQSNNADDLTYNLRRVQQIYSDIIHGPGNTPITENPDIQPSGEATPTGNQPYTDGTIIENDVGQRMVMRNGQWEFL